MGKSVKEILLRMIENHIQPCDCLACRKGGRIDQALAELGEWVKGKFCIFNPDVNDDYSKGYARGYNEAIKKIAKGLK